MLTFQYIDMWVSLISPSGVVHVENAICSLCDGMSDGSILHATYSSHTTSLTNS